MNCATIDSILDERRTGLLSAAERQEATQHLGYCARCAEVWLVHEAVRGEAVADPPPELFAALVKRVAAVPPRSERAWRSRWIAPAGIAAAIALVALGSRFALSPDAPSAVRVDVATEEIVTAFAGAPKFVAGRDYEVLRSATALPASAAGVAVFEFFMWLCSHCYSFEPDLARWDAETGNKVALTRVPAVFYPPADLHARAFYTAEVLGKLEAMHPNFYEEIQVRGNRLDSRAALAEFFARFDVDAATFAATFDSREVDARVRRAVALSQEYAIRATPSFVVAGRYLTNPSLAGPDTLAVVDHLVAKERAESCPARRGPDCK
jgi:thiol:disulfide interchange protein DsbA